MVKAFNKDIRQTIKKNRKRFIAIMIITMLGVSMFSGLKASCVDLRQSGDEFFDTYNLHDLYIVSTLGLTDDDINVLRDLKYIDKVSGIYSESVQTNALNKNRSFIIQSLSNEGIDIPYIIEGRRPENINEVVVTQKFLDETGFSINSTFLIDKREDSIIKEEAFTIVGTIVDVTSVDNPSGCTSFRSSNIKDTTIYTVEDAFDSEIYTSIVLTLENSNSYFCYGDEYKSYVKEVKNTIEKSIKKDRENLRYQELYNEAYDEIYKEEKKADDKLKEAYETLKDGQIQIDDGYVQIYEAISTLNSNEQLAYSEFSKGEQTLEDNRKEIEKGYEQLDAAQNELNQGKEALEQQAGMDCEQIKETYEYLVSTISSIQEQIELVDEEQRAVLQQQLDTLLIQKEQLDVAYLSVLSIEQNQIILDQNRAKLDSSSQLIQESQDKLSQQEASTYQQIYDGRVEIQEQLDILDQSQKDLDEGYKEYEENKKKVEDEFKEAYEKLDELEVATWYIQDRSSLNGYNNIESDADSIEAIASVFPVVFLVIAILIALTTITRMVEEDRSLIGTYKALGFTNREIRKKYAIYSIVACGTGSLLGTLIAFIVLPTVLFLIFKTMYLLPVYLLGFVPFNGILGPIIFIGGIWLSAYIACQSELRSSPSILMRPKAPKIGSRVLLEKIPFIWNRLSFLNKVTIRNLFRYKKRMFMTIFGIAGCMALLLFGFGIKDSVSDLMPRQYAETFKYDCMVVASKNSTLISYIEEDENIDSYMNLEMTSATLIKDHQEQGVTLVVFPNDYESSKYVQLKDLNHNSIELKDGEVYITQNAGNVLGFSNNDSISMRLINLEEAEIKVTSLVKNYLGNYVYMTQNTYESLYEKYEPNSAFLIFSDDCVNQTEYCEELSKKEKITNCLSTEELIEQFSDAFVLINMVVYVIIFMSAALAFVVLFTLSTTNISEREREIATIKVLGFLNSEVHLYVNKETLILTLIGIVLGIPLGRVFVSMLTSILNLPSIYLETSLYTISYVISAGLCMVFALVVNIVMGNTLDEINPIEALKSIE